VRILLIAVAFLEMGSLVLANDARVYWDRDHGNAVQTGSVIDYQDGTTGYQQGEAIVYSDGRIGTKIGNHTLNSDGTESYQAGNLTMHSNGQYSIRNGNFLFNSDGSTIWFPPGPTRQSIVVRPSMPWLAPPGSEVRH
jgi:hypothetical protein